MVEPLFAEARFEKLIKEHKLNFYEMYRSDELFRGDIETDDEASVILRATGITTKTRYPRPQVLLGAPDDLRCELLPQ